MDPADTAPIDRKVYKIISNGDSGFPRPVLVDRRTLESLEEFAGILHTTSTPEEIAARLPHTTASVARLDWLGDRSAQKIHTLDDLRWILAKGSLSLKLRVAQALKEERRKSLDNAAGTYEAVYRSGDATVTVLRGSSQQAASDFDKIRDIFLETAAAYDEIEIEVDETSGTDADVVRTEYEAGRILAVRRSVARVKEELEEEEEAVDEFDPPTLNDNNREQEDVQIPASEFVSISIEQSGQPRRSLRRRGPSRAKPSQQAGSSSAYGVKTRSNGKKARDIRPLYRDEDDEEDEEEAEQEEPQRALSPLRRRRAKLRNLQDTEATADESEDNRERARRRRRQEAPRLDRMQIDEEEEDDAEHYEIQTDEQKDDEEASEYNDDGDRMGRYRSRRPNSKRRAAGPPERPSRTRALRRNIFADPEQDTLPVMQLPSFNTASNPVPRTPVPMRDEDGDNMQVDAEQEEPVPESDLAQAMDTEYQLMVEDTGPVMYEEYPSDPDWFHQIFQVTPEVADWIERL